MLQEALFANYIKMDDYVESLRQELQSLSRCIHKVKSQILTCQDMSICKQLQKDLKQVQWQALFYLEKIANLESQMADKGDDENA